MVIVSTFQGDVVIENDRVILTEGVSLVLLGVNNLPQKVFTAQTAFKKFAPPCNAVLFKREELNYMAQFEDDALVGGTDMKSGKVMFLHPRNSALTSIILRPLSPSERRRDERVTCGKTSTRTAL